MPGVANPTRLLISGRIKEWRRRLAGEPRPVTGSNPRLTPTDAADLLLRSVATARAPSRGGVVRLVFGFGTPLDAFATHAQLGANLEEPVTAARVSQLLGALQERWAADDEARALLDRLADAVSQRLTELGTVATVAELTATVEEVLAPEAHLDGHPDGRVVRGLLRFALERRRAMNRADGSQQRVWVRRRGGVVVLLAEDQALFDAAEALAAEADRLVAVAGDPTRAVVPALRARERLGAALPHGLVLPPALAAPERRVALAAAAATQAVASGAGELHHRDLSSVAALTLTFAGFGGQELTPGEIRERVGVRFPALPPLAQRPVLDALVNEAGLALTFDDRWGNYRATQGASATTGLNARQPTSLPASTSPVGSTGALGSRLEASISSRSFLALGVYAERSARFTTAVQARYGAQVVDLTGVLLDALRTGAAAFGVPWETVRAADAEPTSSSGRRGLNELIRRAWPDVAAAVDAALAQGDGRTPVVLTEASPLARYDNIGLLARWTDLAAPRGRAVWLLVPQLGGNHGAVIDGRPVPLAAPSQFVVLDNQWVDTADPTGADPTGAAPAGELTADVLPKEF